MTVGKFVLSIILYRTWLRKKKLFGRFLNFTGFLFLRLLKMKKIKMNLTHKYSWISSWKQFMFRIETFESFVRTIVLTDYYGKSNIARVYIKNLY